MSSSSTPGAPASSSRARAGVSGRAKRALTCSEWPVKTGTRTHVPETRRPGMLEDLPALVAELLLLVGLVAAVVDQRTGQRQHVERDRLGELARLRELDRGAVVGQLGGPLDHLADLLVELGDAGQPGAGDRLVGRDDHGHQPGLVVQRPQHRHHGHRGAVGVGDDALGSVGDRMRVDLGDHQRDRRGPSARPTSCRSPRRRLRRPWARASWRRPCRPRTARCRDRGSRRWRRPRR